MNKEKAKYLIVFFMIIALIIGLLFNLGIINMKPKAKLKNTKELKKVLNKNDLSLIKEGLYEFSKKNNLKITYTYKNNSISNIIETRFKAIVKSNNNKLETVLIRYIDDSYIINYYDHDGKSAEHNKENFTKTYAEPKFVKIENKEILKKVGKTERERIPDSMNDYTYNNNISYRYYYITKLKKEGDRLKLEAVAINNREFYLLGDIDLNNQNYTYKQTYIEE